MTSSKPHIWFIAPFPPPLNGQSNYNKALLEVLEKRAEITCLETGKNGREKLIFALRNAWIVLSRISERDTVYTSVPGQMGLWPFLLTIAALRLRRLDHFVHHHSFRGINLAPLRSHIWMSRLGGAFQRHVFLSRTMHERYAKSYLSASQDKRALVVPNAFLFAQEIPRLPLRDGPITISHLSVMTREKGVDYFIDLITRLLPCTDFRFILGGPIEDNGLRAEIVSLETRHGDRVQWLGPIQGEAKADFYDRTDLFVLPSKLIDEADPLVLLEAFAAGAVALASSRGCIPDRVMAPEHLLSMDPVSDTELMKSVAAQIAADRVGIAKKNQTHAKTMFEGALDQGEIFLAELGLQQ